VSQARLPRAARGAVSAGGEVAVTAAVLGVTRGGGTRGALRRPSLRSPCLRPRCGCRRGLSCHNAACVFRELKPKWADKAGGRQLPLAPRPRLWGGSRPGAVPGIAFCFGDSAPDPAALSAESAGAAPALSHRAHVPGWAPAAPPAGHLQPPRGRIMA